MQEINLPLAAALARFQQTFLADDGREVSSTRALNGPQAYLSTQGRLPRPLKGRVEPFASSELRIGRCSGRCARIYDEYSAGEDKRRGFPLAANVPHQRSFSISGKDFILCMHMELKSWNLMYSIIIESFGREICRWRQVLTTRRAT